MNRMPTITRDMFSTAFMKSYLPAALHVALERLAEVIVAHLLNKACLLSVTLSAFPADYSLSK